MVLLLGVFTNLPAKTIKALFDYKTFYAPGQGPYIEWYLSVKGNSVSYKLSESGNYEASVAIAFTLKNGDKVYQADRYNLISPPTKDTLMVSDFLDCKRFQLPSGNYQLELTIQDRVSGDKSFSVNQEININYSSEKASVSDIELVRSFVQRQGEGVLFKNGYEIIPCVDNFYTPSEDKLIFYAEAYHTNLLPDDAIALYCYIKTIENPTPLTDFGIVMRKKTAEVIPLLNEINISKLPSGNYELVVELKNKANQSIALSKIFFQRHSGGNDLIAFNGDVNATFVGEMNDKNVLVENIACLQPISNPQQSDWIGNQLKAADLMMMKNFFYDFWQRKNPSDPEAAWNEYKVKVESVQKKFGTRALKGYNTDMGRVYLSYGPPTTINKGEYEPNTYPYEIWRYDKINNYSNKTFVFYNKDMVARNFILLHSDMPGEPYEAAWNLVLRERSIKSKNIDDTGKDIKGVYSGDRTNDNFNTK